MQATSSPRPQRLSPASRPARDCRVHADPEGGGVNPLLNSQFMGVLNQSLARQGADALTRGPVASPEARLTAVEEVLMNALGQSKQTLAQLQQWRNQVDAQIAAQEKQVDRMEFALSKARNDAAYMKALKSMVYSSDAE